MRHDIENAIFSFNFSVPPPQPQTIFLDSKTLQADSDSTPKDMNRIILYDGAGEELANEKRRSKPKILQTEPSRLRDAKYPHIVFLGTGSAALSLYRGDSAILVNLT